MGFIKTASHRTGLWPDTELTERHRTFSMLSFGQLRPLHRIYSELTPKYSVRILRQFCGMAVVWAHDNTGLANKNKSSVSFCQFPCKGSEATAVL